MLDFAIRRQISALLNNFHNKVSEEFFLAGRTPIMVISRNISFQINNEVSRINSGAYFLKSGNLYLTY